MISQIVFFVGLAAAFWFVNWKLDWYHIADIQDMDYITIFGLRKPIPWFMVNFFFGVVLGGWRLGLFGVGR
jgi:hypothetical protein